MSHERDRKIGTDLATHLMNIGRENSLDDEGVLVLILAAAFGWAEAAGFEPKKNPRKLFELASRVWDALSREQRIAVVTELRRRSNGSFDT